jgi:phytoene dehydrogenase-like protein
MVIIVGAGLAGLACATRLEEAGADWLLVESSPGPGGRVVTEVTPEGYRLDRGFQVLLDSYPTARRLLDWEALKPRYFESGALMVDGNGDSVRWERFLNPLRHSEWLLGAPLATSFSLREKITLAAYAAIQLPRSDASLTACECGRSTMEELRSLGLGGPVLEKFLRPFFSGVFLDCELGSDASIFRLDLKKFALGRALLPAGGMGEITRQLADKLPSVRQRYGKTVTGLKPAAEGKGDGERVTGVVLSNGEELLCGSLVLATDEGASRHLLGLPMEGGRPWMEVSTLYFTGDHPLYEGALLVLPSGLKGDGSRRLVAHFTDLTNTAPDYAPAGKRLLSATILTPPEEELPADDLLHILAQAEITELLPRFADWTFLKEVRIRRALPSQAPSSRGEQLERHPASNLWLAGDQCAHASIDSALASGLRAAEEVLATQG